MEMKNKLLSGGYDVAGFEKATLVAFYYTIQRGVKPEPIAESIFNVLKQSPKESPYFLPEVFSNIS